MTNYYPERSLKVIYSWTVIISTTDGKYYSTTVDASDRAEAILIAVETIKLSSDINLKSFVVVSAESNVCCSSNGGGCKCQ